MCTLIHEDTQWSEVLHCSSIHQQERTHAERGMGRRENREGHHDYRSDEALGIQGSRARDIPSELENGHVLTHVLVLLLALGAREWERF